VSRIEYFKLEIFVPATHLDVIQEALHEIGVGKIGLYDHCFAVTSMTGMFRPLDGSTPYSGTPGQVSRMLEFKLETRCPKPLVQAALDAIRRIHPYEHPLVDVIPLANHEFDTIM
jgi:hypothetical protein